MRVSKSSRRALLRLFAAALFSAGALAQPIEIDSSKGVIDGKVAISFWPTRDSRSRTVADPAGFEVRLVPQSGQDKEIGFPCGTWIQPPPDRYKFWLEGQGWISPFSSVMTFVGGPFQGQGGASVTQVAPGGLVALDPQVEQPPEVALRLLHLDSHNRGVPKRELSRRASGEVMRRGVLMPEGRIIATLYDNAQKGYIALGRPVEVSHGRLTYVRPEPPVAESSDLLVVLERPRFITDSAHYDVDLILAGSGRQPDITVPASDRLYALWYGLQGSFITLQATSARVFLEPVDIAMRPGKVEVFRGSLRSLPNVDVHLELPAGAPDQDLAIAVLDLPGRTGLRRFELPPASTTRRLERLPARSLEIILEMPPWVLRESVDLSDGESRSVWFRPTPVLIEGTVYRGQAGHRASVSFRTNPFKPRDELVVETDDSGRYEAMLFRSGFYTILVRPQGVRGPPFREYTAEPIMESTTLDFHIPASTYRVRVFDAVSSDGIAGAEVVSDNEFANGRGSSFPIVTGQDGLADLQPLRPGRVVLTAKAKGYLPSEPLVREVGNDSEEHVLTVELTPVGRFSELRLTLPDGAPASGAQARAQVALDNSPPLWEGRSDGEGGVDIPDLADGAWLLLRHPQAGFLVRRWRARGAEADWALPTASPPLAIRVLRPWGEAPARWAQLTFWVDDVPVTGTSLAWLTSSRVSGTDARGIWRGYNLPRSSIKVLAWMPHDVTARNSPEMLASLAVPLSPPWAEVVEIQSAE